VQVTIGGEATRRAGDAQGPAVDASARAGFAARAVLYGLVGVLAGRLALGDVGEDASQQGAMSEVASQPLGSVLLGALAAGLAGYALYRAWQAVRGKGEGGVVRRRVVPAARSGVNAVLALLAIQELTGAGEEMTEAGVTAAVLGWPGGTWLVGGVGLVIVGVGVHQLHKAWTGEVHELAPLGELPVRARRLAHVVGRAGHLGRAVVFAIVGGFLVRAAWTHDPESGVGLDAALGEVVAAPFGTPLLFAVATGLVLFGLHCGLEAWYGRAADAG
jgi:hypothetical protein